MMRLPPRAAFPTDLAASGTSGRNGSVRWWLRTNSLPRNSSSDMWTIMGYFTWSVNGGAVRCVEVDLRLDVLAAERGWAWADETPTVAEPGLGASDCWLSCNQAR